MNAATPAHLGSARLATAVAAIPDAGTRARFAAMLRGAARHETAGRTKAALDLRGAVWGAAKGFVLAS